MRYDGMVGAIRHRERTTVHGALCLLLSVVATASTASGQDRESASEFVRRHHQAVRDAIRRTEPGAARTARLSAALRDFLDYDAMAREALGDDWNDLDDARRAEVTQLLGALSERSYSTGLDAALEYDVSYVGEVASPRGLGVTTLARSRTEPRRPPIEVIYWLHRTPSGWRVRDIATDGASQAARYQRSFARILRAHGISGLIDHLRTRLAEPE